MSVGGIVGAVAGGIIGSFFPVVGTAYGASLGYAIGGGIDAYLNQPKTQGPRLEDLKIQTSSYGVDIPTKYGSGRQAGNVIWQTPLVEHKHEDSSKGGPTNTTFNYTFDTAIGICVGPIIGIPRIWANKKVVYDSRPSNTGPISDPMLGTVRVYLGDETQTADPLITAISGPSPGYRGLAYVVLEGVDGTETRGRIMWEFEVVASGAPEVSHTNICALTSGDQGLPSFRGESWISERTIILWRRNGPDLNSPLAMFRSLDGGEAQYVGDIGVAPGTSSNRTVPVNTRDQCFIAYTQLIFDPPSGLWFETLTLVRPFSDDEKATFNIAIGAYSGSNTFSADNMVVAYDQDDDVAAIATRSTSAFIYSGTIGIFKGGAVTHFIGGGFKRDDGSMIGGYPFRTAAGEVCCGLAVRNGKVFALIWTGAASNRMDLLVISATDGSLIDTFTGPVAGIDYGDITESIRTDGTSVWAYAPGPGLVWKWGPDGTYRILSQDGGASPGTQVFQDSDTPNPTLGGNMMFIGDTYFISQGQVLANADGAHPIFRHQRVTYAALTGAAVPLSDIVADICLKSGLDAGDIDVSGLTDLVSGYDIPHAMTGRAALLPLQQAYFFDAVSDFKLKFVKRGGAIAATIPEDDRAAHEDGQSLPDALKIVRFNELELPSLVDVEYVDGSADYLVGNQYERRLTKKVISSVDLKLAINLNADQAKRIAATNLYGAWLTQTYAWSTTRKYAHLEPTDVVSLPTAAAIYNVRITKKTEHATGVIDWEGVEEDAVIYTQTGTGTPLAYVPTTIRAQVRTNLSLLDIPILRDADNDPGFYGKVSPNGPAWPGAGIYLDDGTLTLQGSASMPSAVGTALTALPDYTGANVFDETGTVDILIYEGTLTSVTRAQVFAGQNAFLIGKEIIGARDVTLIGTRQYRLGGLLRYRRGTEGMTHAVGDRVVHLVQAGMIRINHGAGDIGLSHKYVPITFGGVFNATDDQTFANSARGLMPFSPVDLRADYGTTPITVSWHRRSRLATRFLPAGVDAPLGEGSERYETDIRDGAGALTATLSSTSPSVAIPTWAAGYTATVFQLSETVGRGTGASLTL